MTGVHHPLVPWPTLLRHRWAIGLSALLVVAAVAHFSVPGEFDAIVPRVLPQPQRFWTLASGVIELSLAIGLLVPRTRRVSATSTAIFFVVVFPANVQMAFDWRSRAAPEFVAAVLRLPLQIPLTLWAWRIRNRTTKPSGMDGAEQPRERA